TDHPFPTCYVCGPERADGLRIFPGPVGDVVATIDAAAAFVITRRGAIAARARTRLFAARCELGQAAAATEAEPVEALAAARAAQSLGSQALAAARADVERWTPPVDGYEGALLGGIVHAPEGAGRPYGSRFGGPGTRDRDRAA
ncbi:hypothetical protein AB0J74_35700, partial [Asanoa sp. NPDC049573]